MIKKTCTNKACGQTFECGTGTKKPASAKFCSVTCCEAFYKDVPSLPPPSGVRI